MKLHLSTVICCSECEKNALDSGGVIFEILQENGEKRFFFDDAILHISLKLRGIPFRILCSDCAPFTEEEIEEARSELKSKGIAK